MNKQKAIAILKKKIAQGSIIGTIILVVSLISSFISTQMNSPGFLTMSFTELDLNTMVQMNGFWHKFGTYFISLTDKLVQTANMNTQQFWIISVGTLIFGVLIMLTGGFLHELFGSPFFKAGYKKFLLQFALGMAIWTLGLVFLSGIVFMATTLAMLIYFIIVAVTFKILNKLGTIRLEEI